MSMALPVFAGHELYGLPIEAPVQRLKSAGAKCAGGILELIIE